MERIDVYRGSSTTDADGNPVQGAMVLWKSFDAYVAPRTETTPTDTSSTGVVIGYAIYLRRDTPSGILDTDLIGVRGERLPVDGFVSQWVSQQGVYRGEEFTVTSKRG